MAVVSNKYRGTTTYHLVFSELISAAQHGGVTSYQEVASIMGLPMQGNHMAAEVGQMLGEISEDEVAQHRPMLSAVAVNTAGQPGSSFFGLAKQMGLLKDESDAAKRQFWERTKAEAYGAWRKKFKPI